MVSEIFPAHHYECRGTKVTRPVLETKLFRSHPPS
jgi:hypothetical protein